MAKNTVQYDTDGKIKLQLHIFHTTFIFFVLLSNMKNQFVRGI